MKRIWIACLLVLFGLCNACNKCHEVKYPLTTEQSEYGNFKIGSYWIMKDSVSGSVDSFVVYDIKKEWRDIQIPNNTQEGCYDKRELLSYQIAEYTIATQAKSDINWEITLLGSQSEGTVSAKHGNGSFFFLGSFDFGFTINGMVINGTSYDSVSKSEDVYVHPVFKLLKMRISKTEVWELVDSYIKY